MLSFTKTGPANSLPGPAEDGGERDPVFTAEEKAGIDPAGEVASDLEAQTGGAAIDLHPFLFAVERDFKPNSKRTISKTPLSRH